MGIHATLRKRRPVGTATGAWVGPVVHTSDEQVMVMIPEEKWSKMIEILLQIKHELEAAYKIDPKKHVGFQTVGTRSWILGLFTTVLH